MDTPNDLYSQQVAQAMERAVADWQEIRSSLSRHWPSTERAVMAVLDIHEPYNAGFRVACSCCLYDSYGRDSVDWPCDTFKAIKDNL